MGTLLKKQIYIPPRDGLVECEHGGDAVTTGRLLELRISISGFISYDA